MRRLIKRLNAYYDQATDEQIRSGMSWYEQAHGHAKRLAVKHNVPLCIAAGVIAALSPNNKWERNLIDADLFLTTPDLKTKVCTFTGQRVKALDILNGARNGAEVCEILGGKKTVNFYRNIMYPDRVQEVTVDLWMFRAANLPHNAKNFALIEQAVVQASKKKNIQPHQYQAVVWSVIRPTKKENTYGLRA